MSASSFANIEYTIELLNAKKKTYDTLAKWLVLINVIVIAFLALSDVDPRKKQSFIIFVFILPLLKFLLEKFFKKPNQQPTGLINYWYWIVVAWIITQYYWLAIANVVLAILYGFSSKKLMLSVETKGIYYPSFPKSFFEWSSLSQVILKDGLLTIDKKDNTLIQQPIKDASYIDEAEFNAYCQSQLEQAP
jgi:hypothetical protein